MNKNINIPKIVRINTPSIDRIYNWNNVFSFSFNKTDSDLEIIGNNGVVNHYHITKDQFHQLWLFLYYTESHRHVINT